MNHPSRRQVLRMGATALAAGLLPTRWALASTDPREVDVVIVGGGLAGLATARTLVEQGVDSFVVLEARDRVGGRTYDLPIPGGHVVEGGGEWIGPGQDRIAALAAAVGVDTFPAYYDGDGLFEIQQHVSRGMLPDLTLRQGGNFMRLAWRLQRMANRLPEGAPWLAEHAAVLDRTTLAEWLVEQGASPWTLESFRIITRAIMSGYPEDISTLWFLFYLQSGGGLFRIASNEGGLQDLRFHGGSQRVSVKAAESLGQRVRLGEPVWSIADGSRRVEVRTPRATYHARRVVVAMAPADTLRVDFLTGLSPQRTELVRRWAQLPRLPLIKHSVLYEKPFWREAGLNGNVATDHAPLQLVFDNSPPDGSLGVLTCFLSPAEVPGLADREERARRVPVELARYFGPQALEAKGAVEKDWATDAWSTGCITPLTPGMLTAGGPALRDPVGKIHWAGTESATRGCGYMDGAVRSGEVVAAEVVAALRG